MKVRILGCGTSSGVPRIGNDWGDCDPAEPKNRRTRSSILVESGDERLLVDCGPDMREQLLVAGIAALDAVIVPHDHADPCHGIEMRMGRMGLSTKAIADPEVNSGIEACHVVSKIMKINGIAYRASTIVDPDS